MDPGAQKEGNNKMKKEDLLDFGKILKFLEKMFLGAGGMSKIQVEGYYYFLKDLELKEIKHAIIYLCYTKRIRSLPTPAEIREASRGTLKDRAIKAWGELTRYADSFELPKSKFKDPLVSEVILNIFGSWRAFQDQAKFPYDRYLFVETYISMSEEKKRAKLLTAKLPKSLLEADSSSQD